MLFLVIGDSKSEGSIAIEVLLGLSFLLIILLVPPLRRGQAAAVLALIYRLQTTCISAQDLWQGQHMSHLEVIKMKMLITSYEGLNWPPSTAIGMKMQPSYDW